MKINISEEQKYLRAKKKVDNIKGFYWNLFSYCVVIPFLIFINLMTVPEYHWFWYPIIGWGIGLAFHAYGVFGGDLIFGKDWEDRKIKEFMDKDAQNKFYNHEK